MENNTEYLKIEEVSPNAFHVSYLVRVCVVGITGDRHMFFPSRENFEKNIHKVFTEIHYVADIMAKQVPQIDNVKKPPMNYAFNVSEDILYTSMTIMENEPFFKNYDETLYDMFGVTFSPEKMDFEKVVGIDEETVRCLTKILALYGSDAYKEKYNKSEEVAGE